MWKLLVPVLKLHFNGVGFSGNLPNNSRKFKLTSSGPDSEPFPLPLRTALATWCLLTNASTSRLPPPASPQTWLHFFPGQASRTPTLCTALDADKRPPDPSFYFLPPLAPEAELHRASASGKTARVRSGWGSLEHGVGMGGWRGVLYSRVLWVATPAVPDLASLHGSPAVFVQQKGQSTGTARQVHLVKGGAVRAQVSRPRLLVAFTSTTPAPTYLCLTALLLPAPCSYPCTVRGPRPTPAPVPPALLSSIPPACCPCPLLSPRALTRQAEIRARHTAAHIAQEFLPRDAFVSAIGGFSV